MLKRFFGVDTIIFVTVYVIVTFIMYNGWVASSFKRSVTIPVQMTAIGEGEFASRQLTNVNIPDGTTSIGNWAFSRNGLTAVDIPTSVTSIGSNAFWRNRITTITIGANVKLGSNAFGSGFEEYYLNNGKSAGTYTLLNSKIKKWSAWHGDFNFQYDNGSITIIGYKGMGGEVTIPRTISGNPVRIIQGFREKNITRIIISGSVTDIGDYAFSGNQLTNLSIPGSVTTIGRSAFSENRLTNVNIPSSVTTIGIDAFYGNQLTNVSIPSSVKNITGFGGNQLTNVSIPSSVTSIGQNAFNNNQLTNVSIPSSVTSIGEYAFSNNRLTKVIVPNSVTSIGICAFEANPITSGRIGANVELGSRNRQTNNSSKKFREEVGVLGVDKGFDNFYKNNGKRAGTYTINNGRWTVTY